MSKQAQRFKPCILLLAAVALAGCAASRSDLDPDVLTAADRTAYSVALQQPDLIVAVSPVRQTMQIGGSIPTILGAGISAIQDNQYGERIRGVLDGYDSNEYFMSRTRQRMAEALGPNAIAVMPARTSAGYHNARDARQARVDGLRRQDFDLALDLDLTYGVYGPEGLLATRIVGALTDLHSGRVLWRNTISAYSLELYADMHRWRDPMERMTPSYFSPRLSTADNAVEQWTADGGARLKQRFETSVNDTIAAVLTDMGLEESVEGRYVLGVQALLGRDYEAAETHLSRAFELDPNLVDAGNGLAIAKARANRLDEAVALAGRLADGAPDYLPLQYNLAWWHAVEMNNPDRARPYYDKAVQLGATPSRRLERAMR